MAAPPTPQEGASQTRPPLFNGKYYGWWKNRMMDHLIGENPDLWGVILDGPTIPMKTGTDGVTKIPKERKEWDVADKLAIQNNAKAKKILICGIGPDEYNRISSCQDAKAIWETLQTAHEGTTQVKKSKVDNLNRQYELFRMAEGETIQEMHTRFTSIINEMYYLGEIVPNGKAVRKLLSVLPESWESKVEAITEARDLDALAMDELIGNLITYELKKNQEKEIGGKRKERNLVLKATVPEDFEDENIALMTKRFSRMLKRGQVFQRRNPQKTNENTKEQVCHKCGSPDHFIKFCPLWALEQKRGTSKKLREVKNDKYIPSNRRMTNQEADLSMKKAFAAMGNLSEEESEDEELENKSLLAIEQSDEYDFLALVAISESEEEGRNICKSQETIQALMAGSDSEEDEEEDIHGKVSLHHVKNNLSSYSKRELESLLYTLINAYQSTDSRRELIMEDYASLREENENLEKQNHRLLSKITELNKNLDSMTKRNEELNKELHMSKAEAENSMRWTRSSILLDNIHKSQTSTKHGIGFDKNSQVKNPNIDCLCVHCAFTGHKSYDCHRKLTAYENNLTYLRKPHPKRVTKQIPNTKPLPRWAKKNLIHLFSNKKGPKWI